MLKYVTLLACCLLVTAAVWAQPAFKGRVMENNTRIGLNGIYIENLTTRYGTLSDKSGKFSLPAKNGDLVFFRGFAYQTDTVLVTGQNNAEVFLEPQQIPLKGVNVISTEITKPLTYYDPQFHNQTVVYHRDRLRNYDGGLTLRVWYWKKTEHDKAKLDKKLKDFDTMDRIHEIFVAQTISKYVPLTGEELDDFIALFTPGVKEFSNKDFSLVTYLSDSYKKYQALPADERKPKPLIQ